MGRGLSKAERIREMERLYVQRAFSDIEMAERLGVDRTTVYRDRIAMEAEYPFIEDEQGGWKIDKDRYISGIRLNLHEALVLYLATRRASRQTRSAQPHVASALEKLALALKQPMTERLVRAAGGILQQTDESGQVQVLETLARGWVERRKVRIEHTGLHSRTPRQYLVSPYLIEPSIWSEGAYLIGESDRHAGIATFKIERIQDAYLTLQEFEIPKTFDEQELLRYAWGIWYADQEPLKVRLRFRAGQAARRLRESKWHPTQKIEELEDGGCIWEAQVAEVREMLPWVRGWGADCEVLEPRELRGWVEDDLRESTAMYGIELQESGPIYYAHSNNFGKSQWQKLKDHLYNTANLAKEFGEDAGIADFAYLAALFHDVGKYSKEFQKRLEGKGGKVDHSTAGAKEVKQLYKENQNQRFMATILAYCIAGHHTGLLDYGSSFDMETDGTLQARLKKEIKKYSSYANEIDLSNLSLPNRLPIKPIKNYEGFSIAFFTHMLYSTLVDSDFQDTETFMKGGKRARGGFEDIKSLHEKMMKHMEQYQNPTNPVNQQRTETLRACIAKASENPGLFTLTVPTGGAKTLSSMAFALEHAVQHGLKRVIYVIPYTTIIEQNAAEFKKCLGSENVLEHHCNFDWRNKYRGKQNDFYDDKGYDALEKLKLAAENWDVPIVVTTNVQFFESLFANRSSRSRKLHNIAKSVIIFDEAQMLPRQYMEPCLYSVYELVRNYGCSAVFCTATQPSVERFLPPGTELQEISPDPQGLYEFYKRVVVKNLGKQTDAALREHLNENKQVLCIVNTRRHARGLFDGVIEEGRFHLSTLMCPIHRKEIVEMIRKNLDKGFPCRVVSTQIMEAGIDVDFPVGYRSMAGLESIIQAAGRVNRERIESSGTLYIFEADTEFIKRIPTSINQQAEFSRSVLKKHSDPICLEAIQEYYDELYNVQSQHAFDAKGILKHFHKGTGELDFDFKTAAQKFKLIEENTVPIIIPYDELVEKLIRKLKYSDYPASVARKLQPYTVNIYESEFEALESKGAIDVYSETYFVLNDMNYYNKESGLFLPERSVGEAIFFDG